MSRLRELIEGHGVALKPAGRGRWRGLCPFHDDHDPSFCLTEGGGGKDRFYCFGCGARGDAIDFLRLTRGLSFREAKRALGEDCSFPSRAGLRPLQRERALREAREERRLELSKAVARACRLCDEVARSVRTPEDLDRAAPFLRARARLESLHETLRAGSPDEVGEVIAEWRGVPASEFAVARKAGGL